MVLVPNGEKRMFEGKDQGKGRGPNASQCMKVYIFYPNYVYKLLKSAQLYECG